MDSSFKLRFLLYAKFTCTYLMVCSVVGMPSDHSKLSNNSTNSTSLDNSTYLTNLRDPDDWRCEPYYSFIPESTPEYYIWGSSVASTIMALLPTLIAITSAVTANIGFLCHLSPTQGYIAAAFTFGLPVRQLDTWKSVTISVKDLLKLPHDEDVTVLNGVEEKLRPIKKMAVSPRRLRLIWVQLLRYLFSSGQGVLIWSLLVAVPSIDSFQIIYLCPEVGALVFSLWLGVTFTCLGWLRAIFERNAFGRNEVIYMGKAQKIGNYWQRLLEPHPMILILRPSNHGQANHLHTPMDYFIGMSQFFWICLLSLFFSSTVGGNLLQTLIMVAMFITIIHVSRGLSILACIVAQKHLNLRVIEYDNLRERRMVQILLGELTGVKMDIRWANCKKGQREESIKMYQWGYQLSHGNLMEDQCTLHTTVQHNDAFIGNCIRIAAFILFFTAGFNPSVISWMNPASIYWMIDQINFPRLPAAEPPNPIKSLFIFSVLLPGVLACWNLGQTKKFLICDCNLRD